MNSVGAAGLEYSWGGSGSKYLGVKRSWVG